MVLHTQQAPDEIDFSTFPDSDGRPMADNEVTLEQMIRLILELKQPLEPLGHHVGGDLLVYYDASDGWRHLAPDVFVALGAGPALRASWTTWVEGAFPEVVFEVASPSTRDRDIGAKVRLYAALGAREYYLFDPAGALEPAFRGYRLGVGGARPLPNPTGLRIASPLLGLELRVAAGWLRVIDPASGAPYPLPAEAEARARAALALAREEQAARLAAEQRAREAEQRAREAEARAREEQAVRLAAEAAQQAAEERAREERAARAATDTALQAALAELARLRAEQGQV